MKLAKRIEVATRNQIFEEEVTEQVIADRQRLQALYEEFVKHMSFQDAVKAARTKVIAEIILQNHEDTVRAQEENVRRSDMLANEETQGIPADG